MFCHLVALPQAGLAVLADAKRKAIYTVHLTGGLKPDKLLGEVCCGRSFCSRWWMRHRKEHTCSFSSLPSLKFLVPLSHHGSLLACERLIECPQCASSFWNAVVIIRRPHSGAAVGRL